MIHYSDTERNDAVNVSQAIKLIRKNELDQARLILQEVINHSPEDYMYSFEENNQLFMKFWDHEEFELYTADQQDKQQEPKVVWLKSAYPPAYYYLAAMDIEKGDYESAITYLDTCLTLEPDQPLSYCEMALVYSGMGQHEQAIALYGKGLKARPQITKAARARALRGLGGELIAIEELEFAEKYLQESLIYEPDNQTAVEKLQYLYQLNSTGPAGTTDPDKPLTNNPQNKCGYCGKELDAQGAGAGSTLNIEDTVVQLCDNCAKISDVEVILLLDVLNEKFENHFQHGELAEALAVSQRALAIAEQNFGANHPEVALVLNNLALIDKKMGRYAEAEPLYKRALEIFEEAVGPKHPDVAIAMSNLAELYRLQGKTAQVEPLLKQALDIKQKALGPEHPSVGIANNSLAAFYVSQNKFDEATPLYEQAMKIIYNAYGPAHPLFAKTVTNVAELYSAQKKYDEAEQLFKMSLEVKEETLGPDHPDVIRSLNGLAKLYQAQGKYAEAEELYARVLDVFKKTMEPNHPQFAEYLSNLASLYEAQDKYAEAEVLYRQALEIFDATLEPAHHHLEQTLHRLVEICQKQERYAEAETFKNRLQGFNRQH